MHHLLTAKKLTLKMPHYLTLIDIWLSIISKFTKWSNSAAICSHETCRKAFNGTKNSKNRVGIRPSMYTGSSTRY